MRCGPRPLVTHDRGRPDCRRYRTHAPLDAKRCHALVDPFDGGGDGLFAHDHPKDLDSFRFAAPSFADIQAFQRSAVRRQGPRHCRSLSIAAQSRAGAQRRREESDTSPRSRTAGLTDDAWRCRSAGTHSYIRHGTTSLFAALDVALGFVIGKCYKRHRACDRISRLPRSGCDAQGFPTASTSTLSWTTTPPTKRLAIKAWLARRPPYPCAFHWSTSASWITRSNAGSPNSPARKLRRGVHTSTLVSRYRSSFIRSFIERHQ